MAMDCIRAIRQLDVPVTKLDVVKYCALRWFLNLECIFQEGVTEVEELHNWRLRGQFTFIFESRDFNLAIQDETTVGNFRIILSFAEGLNSVSVKHELVPEFVTRRKIVGKDKVFLFELQNKFQMTFYEQVLRKVLYDRPVENVESRDGEVHVPHV